MRVLYFYPWGYFHPLSCGADVIATNHLDYFGRRGWDVDCLMLPMLDRIPQAAAFRRRFPWVKSVRLVDMPVRDFSFRGLLYGFAEGVRTRAGREALGGPADLFMTNYFFTAPLLEAVPRGCRRVVEAVDLMTRSFALTQRLLGRKQTPGAALRDRFQLEMELELYGLFDASLFLNENEWREAAARLPGRALYVPPTLPADAETGSRPPQGRGEVFDLLFVGSGAPANHRGMNWFYRDVYLPYLRQHKVRLAVAGQVCNHLDFDDWYVTRLGRVEGSLAELYARSKLAVMPIQEGSGLAIKTMECLAMGRAMVTTPVGARGLPEAPQAYACVDMVAQPRRAADLILDLLAAPASRRAMQEAARAMYERQFGRDRYYESMDRVMQAVGLCDPPARLRGLVGGPHT